MLKFSRNNAQINFNATEQNALHYCPVLADYLLKVAKEGDNNTPTYFLLFGKVVRDGMCR